MQLIENILRARGDDLLAALKGKAGFTTDQAERFIPAAGSSVGDALTARAADLDLSDVGSAANASTILDAVDVKGLAGQAGVSPDQGRAGVAALVPLMLGFLSEQGDGVAGLLQQFAGGDSGALGALKGLGRGLLK